MFRLHHIALTFILALSGLAAQDRPVEQSRERVDEKKTEGGAPAAVDPNTYELGPEDVINVFVFHEPDFTGAKLIRPDGKISFPLVGELQAAGLTPAQLGKNITAKLQAIIKDPQVDVAVAQVNSKKYFIQGEVGRTGQFPLVVPTTVLQALSNCGGFRDFANKKKIIILRKGQRIKFNYVEVINGKKPEQNILLENGDYIIVP